MYRYFLLSIFECTVNVPTGIMLKKYSLYLLFPLELLYKDIIFNDNIRPEKVRYAQEIIRVHKYNPGVLLCNRCAKGGHLAKYCNSLKERCPLCRKEHGKDSCNIPKECANCGGGRGHHFVHTA